MSIEEWPPIGGKRLSKDQPTMVPIEILTIEGETGNQATINKMAETMRKNGYPDDNIYPEVEWNGKAFIVVLGKSRVAAAKLAGLSEIPVMSNRPVLSVV